MADEAEKPKDPFAVLRGVVLRSPSAGELEEARQSLSLSPESFAELLASVRKSIDEATRRPDAEVLAIAIERCNQIYRASMDKGDHKTALGAMSQLDRLYKKKLAQEKSDDRDALFAELERVRAHLLPLGLAGADYPISEHARVAAEMVRRQK